MYRYRINHGCSRWFLMCIICKYKEMFIGDGIFIMFLGNAYLLCISISSPPFGGVYIGFFVECI